MAESTNKALDEFVVPSPSLLASLGTHKRYRPLSPVETARELKNFLEKGGRAEQLPIGREQLREFLRLLDLSDIVKKMIGWGGIEEGEIGIDSGYRISMLEREYEQESLARAILERGLTSKEVRRIVRHRNRHSEKTLDECIEAVVAMRPIKRHLFITQISNTTLKRLEQEAAVKQTSTANVLQEILSEELPENSLISLALREDFVMLLLEEKGIEALKRKLRESGARLKEAINVIVSSHV
jgi:DNA-binding transcriptional MerR regulator